MVWEVREGVRLVVRLAVDLAAIPHDLVVTRHDCLEAIVQTEMAQCLDNVGAAP